MLKRINAAAFIRVNTVLTSYSSVGVYTRDVSQHYMQFITTTHVLTTRHMRVNPMLHVCICYLACGLYVHVVPVHLYMYMYMYMYVFVCA